MEFSGLRTSWATLGGHLLQSCVTLAHLFRHAVHRRGQDLELVARVYVGACRIIAGSEPFGNVGDMAHGQGNAAGEEQGGDEGQSGTCCGDPVQPGAHAL